MDSEVRNWCLEHLLRNSTIETKFINKLISTISLSNTNHRTKKIIILRTLQDALSEAFIPESMLQILEVLEQLLLCSVSSNSNSNLISAAMKAAYCSIAVECTLKYLEAGTSNPRYGKAVERIWKGRVHDMQSGGSSFLVSDELKEWKCEIENSLLDGKVMEKLASMPNTRREAILKVQAFLAEAWENLGPSFLECVVQNQLGGNLGAAQNQSDGNMGAAQNQSDGNVGVLQMKKQQEKVSSIEIRKDNDKVEGKFTTNVDAEELDLSTSCSKDESVPINEVLKNGESLKCSSVEVQTLAKDSGLAIEDMNQEPQMENRSTDANVSDSQMENRSTGTNASEAQMENRSKDANVSEPQMESQSMDANVSKPQMENQSMDANVSEPQMENGRMDADVSEPQMENQSMDANVSEPQMENQSMDADVYEPQMENQSMDANESNLNETASVHQSDAHHPSLMKPNSTARTHEWDDSIDGLQGETSYQASKFSLPSPRRKKHSPLKAYEPKNFTKRRRPKKWSKLEEDTLRAGVSKFGRGNWKSILNAYTFEERTEVDLKDKWRNMTRYGG